MKLWLIFRILSVTNLQKLWIIKSVNLLEFYSFFINLTSLLNGTPLTSFMSVILQELLIQSNHHLLSKGTPCWNQQSSTMKIRQSGCLKKSWIHNIQDQIIVFNTRFTELTVTLILSGITWTVMSSRMHWKLNRNTTHNILTSQVCSLLSWNWFIISQQEQAKGKFKTQSQRLF